MVQRLKYLLCCVNWYEFHICLEKLKIDEKTFFKQYGDENWNGSRYQRKKKWLSTKKVFEKNWKKLFAETSWKIFDQPEKPNLVLESDGRLERDLLALQD